EAGFLVGLRVQGEFQQEPVLLRGQLDLKRGCHVDMIRGWHLKLGLPVTRIDTGFLRIIP
ncbi:hypothetical protein CSW14_02300, partial [Thermus scotoductus]